MIAIKIAGEERSFENIGEVDESWVTQHINKRHEEKQLVCVRVRIEHGAINMILETPTCQSASGGGCGRPATPAEREMFNLWEKHGLKEIGFRGGNVISFLKQLKNLIYHECMK